MDRSVMVSARALRATPSTWVARGLGVIVVVLSYFSIQGDLWPPLVELVGFADAVSALAGAALIVSAAATALSEQWARRWFGVAALVAAVALLASFPEGLGAVMLTVIASGLQGAAASIGVIATFADYAPTR